MAHVVQADMTGHTKDRSMAIERNANTGPDQPMIYHIRIKGHLGGQWSDWFGGLSVTLEDNGDTLLTGPVVDQAALHGLLRKVRDLGMTLLLVKQVSPDLAERSESTQTRR
jgi:hypothetical protein